MRSQRHIHDWPPHPPASEQDARNATVRATKIAEQALGVSRRQALLGVASLIVAAGTGYLGVAATKNYWPFGNSSATESIQYLAGQLKDANSSEQRIAVLHAIGARARIEHPNREAAVSVLTSFLRNQDGVDRRQHDNKAPTEVSMAFTLLGRSGTNYQEADLRYADLSGLDVKGLDFSRGVTLYGANLTGAVIIDSKFGPCNAGTVNLTRAWFGGCLLSGLNLIDAKLGDATFPGTRLADCQLAGAEISGADFTKSQIDECDFTGERLVNSGRYNAQWDPDRPPEWPAGFQPNIN